MKALINRNPRDLRQAVTFAEQARANGSQAMIAGGGSDLLGMVKDRIAKVAAIARSPCVYSSA